MVNWKILGIAPTKDTDAIKNAYRAQLVNTNPEDDPEAFMALRSAYEEALRLATEPEPAAFGEAGSGAAGSAGGGAPDSGSECDIMPRRMLDQMFPPEHPIYPWIQSVIALYEDFGRRINLSNWEELLADPLCTGAETAEYAEQALLLFLMDSWFLPDDVICAMNDVFHFDENAQRLMDIYPPSFVQTVLLLPLTHPNTLDYDLFNVEEGRDYETFIGLYYNLISLVDDGEFDEAMECLDEIENTGIFHPFINIEKAKIHLGTRQQELAEKDMDEVIHTYYDSPNICCMAGEVALTNDKFDDALEYFSHANELDPAMIWPKLGMGESLMLMNRYNEADHCISQVLAVDRYNERALALEDQIAEGQRGELEKKLADGKISCEESLRLAECFIDDAEPGAARDLLFSRKGDTAFSEGERLHLLATAELDLGDCASALKHFGEAEKIMRQSVTSKGSDEKRDMAPYIGRTMVMSSVTLEAMGRMDEALETVTNASVDFPMQPMVFCRKAEVHFKMAQYREAVDAASESIRLDPASHIPYCIRADAYRKLGMYSQALSDCDAAIFICSDDLTLYFRKIEILTEAGDPDSALDEIDRLESQVQGSQLVFLRGKAYEAAGEPEEALEQYQKALSMERRRRRRGSESDDIAGAADIAETYFRIYRVLRSLYETSDDRSFRLLALTYLEEGRKNCPGDTDILSALAGEYFCSGRYQEAEELYDELIGRSPDAMNYALRADNEIYTDEPDRAEKDIEAAEKLDSDLLFPRILLGDLRLYQGRYQESVECYRKALPMAEAQGESPLQIYRGMYVAYCRMKDFEGAEKVLSASIERFDNEADACYMIQLLSLQEKFREAFEFGDSYIARHGDENCQLLLDYMARCAMRADDPARFRSYNGKISNIAVSHFNSGRYLIYHDDLKGAYNEFLCALEENASQDSLIALSAVCRRLKKKDEAEEYASEAGTSIPESFTHAGPNKAYSLTCLALSRFLMGGDGHAEEAKEYLSEALSTHRCSFCLFSGCLDAYIALAYICLESGDRRSAERYVELGKEILSSDYDLNHILDSYTRKKKFFK